MNQLYYGDNLQVPREHIADESVDLIYLDPPLFGGLYPGALRSGVERAQDDRLFARNDKSLAVPRTAHFDNLTLLLPKHQTVAVPLT